MAKNLKEIKADVNAINVSSNDLTENVEEQQTQDIVLRTSEQLKRSATLKKPAPTIDQETQESAQHLLNNRRATAIEEKKEALEKINVEQQYIKKLKNSNEIT